MSKLFKTTNLLRMALLWDPSAQTDDENLRWCWLRAVEWDSFILFVTQPIVPLLMLLNVSWVALLIVLLILNWLWQLTIAYRYVNVVIADMGSLFVHLKWFASIGVGVYFLINADYMNTAISAAWPLVVLIMTFFSNFIRPHKAEIGSLQTMFIRKLGYQKRQDMLN
ncbi:MAG: hypothetical protein WAO19_10605 [Candidatus Kryptoniota bacterium]